MIYDNIVLIKQFDLTLFHEPQSDCGKVQEFFFQNGYKLSDDRTISRGKMALGSHEVIQGHIGSFGTKGGKFNSHVRSPTLK